MQLNHGYGTKPITKGKRNQRNTYSENIPLLDMVMNETKKEEKSHRIDFPRLSAGKTCC